VSASPLRPKYCFVTGLLADQALRETVSALPPDVPYAVVTLKITVAALLSTDWTARHLDPGDCDVVMVPGLSRIDEAELSRRIGKPVERGPKDLRDIPAHFGLRTAREGYGAHAITIFAEVNDATRLPADRVLRMATRYRLSGADVIDLGCVPGDPAPDRVRDLVALLRREGFRASVDTFDPAEARAGDAAGADYLLSVNSTNVEVVRDLRMTPVVIPDAGSGVASLAANVAAVEARGCRRYLLDPILEPVPFGLAASIERLAETRRRWPEREVLTGLGNVTELLEADSTGVTALFVGIMAELGIQHVLTTEVANWCRGAVRELDRARRLMHYAVTRRVLPKGVDDGLLVNADRRPNYPSEAELRAMHAALTDPNYRIAVDGRAIYLFNATRFVKGTDIRALFEAVRDDLGHEPVGHAFYLGRELMRAQTALALGKAYIQEEPLRWGYLDDPVPETD
jgi:dihydropteroate synthase-like protein